MAEQFLWPTHCPYCGRELTPEQESAGGWWFHHGSSGSVRIMQQSPAGMNELDRWLLTACPEARRRLAHEPAQMLEPQASSPEDAARGYRLGCKLSGHGRGDCEHFVGRADELDVDEYGIPVGWCDYCWLSRKLTTAERGQREAEEAVDYWRGRWHQDDSDRSVWTYTLSTAANERNNARHEAVAAKADGERWRKIAAALLEGPDGAPWRELVAERDGLRARLHTLQDLVVLPVDIDISFPDGKGYIKRVWPESADEKDTVAE